MPTETAPWRCRLSRELQGATALVGVGNPLRGDDAAGVMVAQRLRDCDGLRVYDAGVSPENIVGKVCAARPAKVIVVDAVDFGASPGAAAWFGPEEIEGKPASCHAPSLALFAAFVHAQTGASTAVLGIQPGCCDFAAPLTEPVARAVDDVVRAFERLSGRESGDGSLFAETGAFPGEGVRAPVWEGGQTPDFSFGEKVSDPDRRQTRKGACPPLPERTPAPVFPTQAKNTRQEDRND